MRITRRRQSDSAGLSVAVRISQRVKYIYSASMSRKRTRYDEEEISPRYLIMIELYGTYRVRVKLEKRLYKFEISFSFAKS